MMSKKSKKTHSINGVKGNRYAKGGSQDRSKIGGDLILDLWPKHPRRKETNDA